MSIQGLHQGQPILTAGAPLERAAAAMLLIHGRGAQAENILELAMELNQPEIAYLAPQAAGDTWYPETFLAPTERNEPWLSSGFAVLADLLAQVQGAGIPLARTMLLGFSQGACLTLEFVARNTQRYGGVVGLSGGLIGPYDADRNYLGSLADTPVFLGCSDSDSHIPKERLQLSHDVLERLGGQVTLHLYPNMGHTINDDEVAFIKGMMITLITR